MLAGRGSPVASTGQGQPPCPTFSSDQAHSRQDSEKTEGAWTLWPAPPPGAFSCDPCRNSQSLPPSPPSRLPQHLTPPSEGLTTPRLGPWGVAQGCLCC